MYILFGGEKRVCVQITDKGKKIETNVWREKEKYSESSPIRNVVLGSFVNMNNNSIIFLSWIECSNYIFQMKTSSIIAATIQ